MNEVAKVPVNLELGTIVPFNLHVRCTTCTKEGTMESSTLQCFYVSDNEEIKTVYVLIVKNVD